MEMDIRCVLCMLQRDAQLIALVPVVRCPDQKAREIIVLPHAGAWLWPQLLASQVFIRFVTPPVSYSQPPYLLTFNSSLNSSPLPPVAMSKFTGVFPHQACLQEVGYPTDRTVLALAQATHASQILRCLDDNVSHEAMHGKGCICLTFEATVCFFVCRHVAWLLELPVIVSIRRPDQR